MEEILKGTGEETGTTIDARDDEFGYRWMVLKDPDMEDLVVGINAVSTEIQAGGYGDRLLAAVFSFRDEQGPPRLLDLQLQARLVLPVRAVRRRAAARQRARAAAEGPDRRRPAARGRARALVPALGRPALVRGSGSSASPDVAAALTRCRGRRVVGDAEMVVAGGRVDLRVVGPPRGTVTSTSPDVGRRVERLRRDGGVDEHVAGGRVRGDRPRAQRGGGDVARGGPQLDASPARSAGVDVARGHVRRRRRR